MPRSVSGSLFLVRGLAKNLGATWAMCTTLRYLSHAIDTILLSAALSLAAISHQYPIEQHWLTAKVALLVVYSFSAASHSSEAVAAGHGGLLTEALWSSMRSSITVDRAIIRLPSSVP